ncbi:MAG: hypothetical protein C0596_06725 [Marinilabiliales bacterium]|nr:MAG: hypothetical protein C0596_06725 [Marinilabiliales bacterium]
MLFKKPLKLTIMKTSLLSCLFITISVFMFGQNTGVAKNLTNQGVKLNVASDLIYQGVKLHDAGKFDEAIIKYDEALEADKNNLTALYEKSYTLSTIGKNEDAIECCKLAVKHHPDDEDLDMIYVVWGNALDAIGEMNDAIEIYNEGIEKFPEFYLIYFNKGITYSSNKYYDKALSCFEEAITFNINHASSHNGIARLNQMDENYVPAVLAYTYFLIIEPEGSRAKLNIQEI